MTASFRNAPIYVPSALHPCPQINNLGDPFVTSNYAVHSRQFELAVVDFFAKLWKLPKREDYWGYVTTCGTEVGGSG